MVKLEDILFIIFIVTFVSSIVLYIWNVEQYREEFCEDMNMVYELKPADARCIDYINNKDYHIIEIDGKMYLEEKLLKCYDDASVSLNESEEKKC